MEGGLELLEFLAPASSTLLLDDSESASYTWGYSLGLVILFVIVIYLLCNTADNYFSPVLAAICDLLDMPPEVAGVTFLAFGNGAPDVFSSLAALTSASTDKEAALLVGVGSLVGSAMFTTTLVVGGVLHVKSTAVPPGPFARDVLFLMTALLFILWSAVVGEVSIWMSVSYLALYMAYVAFVFVVPTGTKSPPSPLSAGGVRSGSDGVAGGEWQARFDSAVPSSEDTAVDARWIPPSSDPVGATGGGAANGGRGAGGGASAPADGNEHRPYYSGGNGNPFGATRANGGKPPPRGGVGGRNFSDHGFSVKEEYFLPPSFAAVEEDGDEEGSLLGRDRRREEEMSTQGSACSRVPGSTVSMFLEDDDSAASWLARRRWGGNFWGRAAAEDFGDESVGMIAQPLLGDSFTRNVPQKGSRVPAGATGSGDVGDDPCNGGNRRFSSRRFEEAWATLQWKQWRLRRRLKRQLLSGDVWDMPWYRKVVYFVELPMVLLRNATIPPVEADSWSQLQAALATATAPTLVVWAFGFGLDGVFGTSVPWIVVSIGVGVPAGVTVWLTTHKRRMPSARWYRLALALVAFVSCVAWIYYLADLAVALIESIGTATGISSSVLGLTFLAWGNSSGDLVTNVAVARAGYPGMAIAGSYGGPLFNLLLGIGLPMFWNCCTIYPQPSTFQLDAATVVTAAAPFVVLCGTLPTVAMYGFRFPQRAPLALVGCYAVYLAVVLSVTLAS